MLMEFPTPLPILRMALHMSGMIGGVLMLIAPAWAVVSGSQPRSN